MNCAGCGGPKWIGGAPPSTSGSRLVTCTLARDRRDLLLETPVVWKVHGADGDASPIARGNSDSRHVLRIVGEKRSNCRIVAEAGWALHLEGTGNASDSKPVLSSECRILRRTVPRPAAPTKSSTDERIDTSTAWSMTSSPLDCNSAVQSPGTGVVVGDHQLAPRSELSYADRAHSAGTYDDIPRPAPSHWSPSVDKSPFTNLTWGNSSIWRFAEERVAIHRGRAS